MVELTGKFPVFGVNVKLEKTVAWRESHEVELTRVPSADHKSAAGGVVFNLFYDLFDLIDATAFGRFPISPLGAVDAAEVSIFVGPLVPDANFVFL